jgi:RimJ/RimL family protein N-acetyltransferase
MLQKRIAIVNVARELKVLQLYALCHPNNTASIRVLDKCGFLLEHRPEQFLEFPNLPPNSREDSLHMFCEAL